MYVCICQQPAVSGFLFILVTYGDCQVGKYPGFAIFNFSISAGVHYPPSSLLADLAALVVSPLSHWLMPVALVVSPHFDWSLLGRRQVEISSCLPHHLATTLAP